MKKIIKAMIALSVVSIGAVAITQTNIFPKNFIMANLERFRETPNENEILASGNVEVTEVNVGFTLAGRISAMFAEEGEAVAQGEKLATLDNAEMTSVVQQNNAALYEALARLEELKTGSRTQEVGQARANVSAIQAQLEKAQKDYELLRDGINNLDGNDVTDTSPTFKVLEEGASTLNKEEAGQLAQRQMKFIQHLQSALIRIENKTYGICRETGKLIPKERLRAVPHATLSIEAKGGGVK